VIVVATSSGGTSHPASTASHPASSAGAKHPASVVTQGPGALSALPGGIAGASGAVHLSGATPPKITLTVSGLPAPAAGAHYEAWLFSSVLDSVPLGTVAAGHSTQTFALPAGAGHYASIDVSLQPAGGVSHSGDSVLRTANPAAHAG
jgi:hypothetical protein